jgi:hypothetical protein
MRAHTAFLFQTNIRTLSVYVHYYPGVVHYGAGPGHNTIVVNSDSAGGSGGLLALALTTEAEEADVVGDTEFQEAVVDLPAGVVDSAAGAAACQQEFGEGTAGLDDL